MVFHSVPESESRPPPPLPPPPPPPPSSSSLPAYNSSMASAFSSSPKSQPLHNFPLSNLKWSMNQSNTQRLVRRSPDSTTHLSSPPPSHHHHHHHSDQHHRSGRPGLSPLGKSENRLIKISYPTANSSGSGNPGRDDGGKTVTAAATAGEIRSSTAIESSEKKLKPKREEKVKVPNSHHQTVVIRLPAKIKAAASTDATDAAVDDEIQCADEVAKTWNLRPRRPLNKPPNAANVQESKPQPQNQPELAVVRAAPEEKVAKKRQRFSVPLSKEDIEQDFLLMTGSKPPRRPKKRARNVQKLLDVVFPGLWLTAVTPDLYRVPDAPLKIPCPP